LETVHGELHRTAAGAWRRNHGIHLPGEQSVRPGRRPRKPVLQMKQRFLGATAVAVVCLVGAAAAVTGLPAGADRVRGPLSQHWLVASQSDATLAQAGQDRPVVTQDVFKTVTVLRDIPVDTFFDAMGMFANAMG